MKTVYFATREIARIIAREEGETFKDMGKDAPKGERWAVLFKELSDVVLTVKSVEMNVPTEDEKKVIDDLTAAFAAMDIKQAELPKPDSVLRNVVQTMKDRKGNSVQVFTKRRVAV